MSASEQEQTLDRLLHAYRQAADYGEPSANFMPELWARIESRRSTSLAFERLARIFATGAVAVTLLAGAYVTLAPAPVPQVEETWVENLANHQLAQRSAYFGPVQIETAAYQASPTAYQASPSTYQASPAK
jgi:hypothetical protein